MSHTDTILVIVDPEARHYAALAKGALLAEKYHAGVQLIACIDAGGQRARTLRTTTSRKLQTLARCLRENGLNVSTEAVPVDCLHVVLAERLSDNRTSFIIKDVRRRSAMPADMLSAGELALAQVCTVPLLLSKPTLWPELPRIGVVLDPEQTRSPLGHAIMTQSRTLADRLDGRLHVLHSPAPARLRCSVLVMGSPSRESSGKGVVEGLLANLLKQIRCDLLLVKAPPARRPVH